MTYNRQNDNIFANSREDNPDYYNYSLCCGTAAAPYSFSSPFDAGVIQFGLGSNKSPNSYSRYNPSLATGVNPISGTPNGIGGAPPPQVEIYGAWPNTPDAYTYLYSFEIQTNLYKNLVFTASYQGATSRHLIRLVKSKLLF